MIKSMTAFSRAAHTHGTITVEVTIRSVNSRFLDMALHCPESCLAFEEDIKKILQTRHSRGRMDIRLSVSDDAKDAELFEVDEPRVNSYFQALTKIRQDLKLTKDVCIADVLSAKNMIVPSKKETDTAELWKAVAPCMEAAGEQLEAMRMKEGENLFGDLSGRMDFIESSLKSLEIEAAEIPAMYKKRLMERIGVLTSDAEGLDPVRLSQEAAILADKSDVTEEITRLYSHIVQFREALNETPSQGRKLNFLIQEFNREFNTIGSKAGNAALSHQVVALKSELEKIREQVQNIE